MIYVPLPLRGKLCEAFIVFAGAGTHSGRAQGWWLLYEAENLFVYQCAAARGRKTYEGLAGSLVDKPITTYQLRAARDAPSTPSTPPANTTPVLRQLVLYAQLGRLNAFFSTGRGAFSLARQRKWGAHLRGRVPQRPHARIWAASP